MLENSTKENDKVKRRCVLIKPNEELEEVLVCLSDKEAVKKLIGGEAEYKGEMENQNVAILGCVHSPPLTHRAKETKDLQKNDLGFELTPPCDTLYGTLLAFLVGENGMPIDLSVSHFRRSKKTLRKRQKAPEKVEEEEEEEAKEEETEEISEVYVEGLPYETTEEQIHSFFADCGEIAEVRMPRFRSSPVRDV